MSQRVEHLFGTAVILLLAASLAVAEEQNGPDARLMIKLVPGIQSRERIAVPDARVSGSLSPALDKIAKELTQVLSDDLRYSGVFDLVPRTLYASVPATTPERVPYEDWVAIHASWLALVDLSMQDGRLVLKGYLFETKIDRKLVLGKKYDSRLENARLMVHTFADAIISQVGGEPGVATTQIAFVSDREGGRDREIFIADYDGDSPRRATGNRKLNLSPDWSPQNDLIAYTSYLRGNPDLYILPRAGGASRVLFAKPGLNSSPAWSPDGRLLAFASSSEGGDTEIYTIEPAGTGLRRLTRNKGIDTNPAWSPNGRELAFTSDRSGKPDLWLMDSEGLNLRRLLTQGSFNDGAAWAPRGKNTRIAFSGMSGGVFQVFVHVIETGELFQLTNEGSNEAPTWSPDGRQIAYASTRGGKTDIYVMTDDGQNQRRITSGGNNVSPDWSNR